MTFDQALSNYVNALNKFYSEQDQAAYDKLIIARTTLQERDKMLLDKQSKLIAFVQDIADNQYSDLNDLERSARNIMKGIA